MVVLILLPYDLALCGFAPVAVGARTERLPPAGCLSLFFVDGALDARGGVSQLQPLSRAEPLCRSKWVADNLKDTDYQEYH